MHQSMMGQMKEENGDEAKQNAPEYRDRLRTWLIKMIDSGTIPGLQWENEEKTIFRMPWKHAGRQDYSLEEDSRIFMAWAIHSGRYREGIDKPEPIIWKTRLRCALNKMPDIREIPERSRLDISEPYRVYNLLPPVHKDTQIRRRLQRRNSTTSNSESARLVPPLSSPTFPRRDSVHNTATSLKLKDSILPPPSLDLHRGGNHCDITRPSHLDLGMLGRPGHWLGAPSLLPASESGFFQGLNFNGLSSTANFQNLMNSANPFSSAMMPREYRHRPDLDFSPMPYQPSLVDQLPFNPFLRLPGASQIGGLAGFSKPHLLNRSLQANGIKADDSHIQEKMGRGRKEETNELKCKIELLELEISRWKNAYEKERLAREETERKYEYLQKALENVGGDILAMIRHENRNEQSPERGNFMDPFRPMQKPCLPSARRVSADDSSDNNAKSPCKRSQRHSADNISSNYQENSKNDENSSMKRRHDKIAALDLSSTTPNKKARANRISDKAALNLHVPCMNKDITDDTSNRLYTRGNNSNSSQGTAFRVAGEFSSRLSSDCDETEVSTNQIKSVKSPSVSSSYSSAEDSYVGSSLSPTIQRSSPVLPIFRSNETTKYSSYSQRVEGAIQVT